MQKKDEEKIKNQIPPDLLQKIEALESSPQTGKAGKKIAVFDLDNTLLIGDIGDAVFAQLLLDKAPIAFSWQEYQGLLDRKKKREAYEKVITTMAGLPLDTLIETTEKVMHCGLDSLKLPETEVPVPVPHPVMQALLKLLKAANYEIYVISATNRYSVRFVAREFFDLPESHVFGIKPVVKEIEDEKKGKVIVLGSELEPPVTVAEGKTEIYKKYAGTTPPLLTAGDSETDIPMLNLAAARGLIIWVGTDTARYEAIKPKIEHPENLYYFPRGAGSR
ncbi:MAG: haloacid dehalogenase-like hydrolase [Candidatus Aminicenantes bacterium]|nr:haloacid dehalogenase-like hydrolase [Candidatus Aminicenantes bacterium]